MLIKRSKTIQYDIKREAAEISAISPSIEDFVSKKIKCCNHSISKKIKEERCLRKDIEIHRALYT